MKYDKKKLRVLFFHISKAFFIYFPWHAYAFECLNRRTVQKKHFSALLKKKISHYSQREFNSHVTKQFVVFSIFGQRFSEQKGTLNSSKTLIYPQLTYTQCLLPKYSAQWLWTYSIMRVLAISELRSVMCLCVVYIFFHTRILTLIFGIAFNFNWMGFLPLHSYAIIFFLVTSYFIVYCLAPILLPNYPIRLRVWRSIRTPFDFLSFFSLKFSL